ncbi:GPI-anchored cell wall beta-1,3-endoglucanase EglC [Teratosphaeria nubilosa]|uniref:glucan endo-1,3-beta-D-glucosidase n=1 Tax=Teratosphaeria nubilosa TaxID=161662 RepID=A0A6G1KZR5_9PEZI|nr:GPI-anchored cell wall beta-1,3-endoglucanase EglC [Teratosphaeria nubilosa]
MRFAQLAAAASALAAAQAAYTGFNTGSTFADGKPKQQADFDAEFSKARSLAGTNGHFTSCRLFTMIQAGTVNDPISAIPAAIASGTSLLPGLWASAGQAAFDNEKIALQRAVDQYGESFIKLVVGISVGSEDLYRNSPTGIMNNNYNGGVDPHVIVDYIGQIRALIKDTPAAALPIGHADTWTAFVNASNSEVIPHLDWLGMDTYPYYQTTMENSIDVSEKLFWDAYHATVGVSQGKPVMVTETGWPTSGDTKNKAVASIANAQRYYASVGCSLFGKTDTWWYTLLDSGSPNPSFGVCGADIHKEPLYNLNCPAFDNPK